MPLMVAFVIRSPVLLVTVGQVLAFYVFAVRRTMHNTFTLLHSIIEALRHLPDIKMSVTHTKAPSQTQMRQTFLCKNGTVLKSSAYERILLAFHTYTDGACVRFQLKYVFLFIFLLLLLFLHIFLQDRISLLPFLYIVIFIQS